MNPGPTIAVEALRHDAEFRPLASVPGLQVDLRYAGANNLLGRDLYSPHDCAWLHAEAAAALEVAAGLLAQEHPQLRLCVLDAVRPQRVQEAFWAFVEGTPMQPYFAHPGPGSIHSFGMAVDITLVDASGRELDMGTGFDDTTEHSHPALETRWLDAGQLRPDHLANRLRLRETLQRAGWQGIDTEWWHFDFGNRSDVRQRYRRIT